MPAFAGIHLHLEEWIPACAGMTRVEFYKGTILMDEADVFLCFVTVCRARDVGRAH